MSNCQKPYRDQVKFFNLVKKNNKLTRGISKKSLLLITAPFLGTNQMFESQFHFGHWLEAALQIYNGLQLGITLTSSTGSSHCIFNNNIFVDVFKETIVYRWLLLNLLILPIVAPIWTIMNISQKIRRGFPEVFHLVFVTIFFGDLEILMILEIVNP